MSDTINIGGIQVSKFYLGGSSDVKIYLGTTKLYPHLQEPCFAVVDNISTYTARTYVDVYETSSDKWYKLNNLNAYEEYGVYGSSTATTYYDGKLVIQDNYEYQYSGSSWANVGEISGSSRLPQGYTEVEYIEDSGSQYIDTGVYLDTSNFEVGCEVINSYCFWGYCHQDRANGTWLGIESTTSHQTAFYGKFISSDINNISSYLSSVENTIVYTQSGVTVNGSVLSKSLTMGSDNIANKSLVFFGRYDFKINNIEWGTNSKFKSFYVKNNGTLVRDFVPAKRDSDDKYGMYDLVTETFYTSPNGNSFSGGAETGETVYPVYYTELQDPPNYLSFSSMTEAESYECPWVGMKATIAGSGYTFNSNYEWEYIPSRLPVGYTEVEYIENESVAYINTSFKPNQDTRVIARMQTVTSMMHARFFGAGAWNGSNGYQFDYENYYDGQLHISWGAINGWSTYNYYGDYSAHTYDWNKNVFTIDNGVFSAETTYTSFQCTDNLGLFVHIYNGEPCGDATPWSEGYERSFLHGRLYSCQIYDNGTLIRDFVPCTRDSDSKVGVYDIVNDVFYSSAYSGYEFTAGPTV